MPLLSDHQDDDAVPYDDRPVGRGRRSVRPAALVAGAVIAVATILGVVVLGSAGDPNPSVATLDMPRAAVLGAVEGITEFLPVSSTGHLVVSGRLLGLGGDARAAEALDSYAVIIQGGAILAVGWLFRERLFGVVRAMVGVLGRRGERREVTGSDRPVATAILVAAAPAAALGLAAGDIVKSHLFSPAPIALAWAAGGLVLLATAGWLRRPGVQGQWGGVSLEQVTARHALIIGLAQAAALWPGVSRSLVTIVAGCLAGLTLAAAVELSFLVGFVVLLGASGFEAVRHGSEIVSTYGWGTPLLGMVVAFACAAAAIRWLLRVVSDTSRAGLGWYRLAAAATTVGLLAAGRL